MAVNQESVSRILSVLSHSLRREILQILSDKGEASFTDLMNALNVDTGKLSFHIRTLAPFLEQTTAGKYKLSKVGENAIRLIMDLKLWAEEVEAQRKTPTLPIASFKKRTLAFLIDLFMMLAIAVLVTLPNTLSLLAAGNILGFDPNIILLTLALLWLYSTLFEGFKGQSIGKRIIGLMVVRTDGKGLSYDYAAVRNFGKAFLLPFDLLIGLKVKDERYVRYFDKFVGTTVIDLRI
ncbi:MAG TPA: RDD family protein [Candidatus Bathyarchaeia archaeon]|nr:RDD family protein [Candidatus Bathyarchaeia archaeon]